MMNSECSSNVCCSVHCMILILGLNHLFFTFFSETDLEPEGQTQDDADAILKHPVLNKETVKKALVSSTARIAFFRSNSVHAVMETYPYLKNVDLVCSDHK